MYIDPDVYNPETLRKNDRAKYDVIEETADNVLNADVIEDFIETKEVSGETIQKLYRDVLTDYVSFLKERVEYCKADFLIETIESYPEGEIEERVGKLREKRKKESLK